MMKKNKVFLAGITLTAFLVPLYVVQLNSITALAWHIAKTEEQVVRLKHRNTALQTQAYEAMPLSKLQNLAQVRQFEKVTSITYIRMPSGLVAQSQ